MSQGGATSIDLIQAIGSLWKLLGVIAFLVVIWSFREELKKALSGLKTFRVKKGGTELSLEKVLPEELRKSGEVTLIELRQESQELRRIEEIAKPKEPIEWFMEMDRAFHENRYQDAEEAFKKLQASEEKAVERIRNEVYYLCMKYTKGLETNAPQRLEELAKNEEVRGDVLPWLAWCYEFSQHYAEAVAIRKRALAEKISDEDKALHVVSIAEDMYKMGQKEAGINFIRSNFGISESDTGKAILYRGIASLYGKEGDTAMKAIALQKALQFRMEDKGLLFDAAYAQSEAKFSRLCATNYYTLLKFSQDHDAALNNLGVECETLGMRIRSIEYYSRAVKQGHTLAMANLAYRYMDQGFGDEARNVLDAARVMENPHKNVGAALANLEDRKENENKKWEAVTNDGIRQQEFFWEYAEGYFLPLSGRVSFVGEWVSDTGKTFVIEEKEGEIIGKWETEEKGEKFTGRICNRSAEIRYEEKGSGILQRYWGASLRGFAYLSADGKTLHIHVYEKDPLSFFSMYRREALGKNGKSMDVCGPIPGSSV